MPRVGAVADEQLYDLDVISRSTRGAQGITAADPYR
jgi:hypothetical protein